MLIPAGPSSELWAVAWLQRMMVPAQMLRDGGHLCDNAALVTSPEGRYSQTSALATSASGHEDISLHVSDGFRCALLSGRGPRST